MKWTTMFSNGLVLGSLGFLAGCLDPVVETPLMCEEPPLISQGKINGVGGTNGLNSTLFHQVSDELLKATQVSLSDFDGPPLKGGVYPVSQAVKEVFLKDDPMDVLPNGKKARQEIFEHAVQCALPDGVWLEDGDRKYPGKGLLTTTAGWFGAALTTEQAEDLFACMAVLLNPNHESVPVFLSGPSADKRQESYPHIEALWTVDITSTGRPQYHVWPILDVQEATDCWGEDVAAEEPWKYRVCGSNLEDCELDVRLDLWKTECQEVAFTSEGKPTMDGSHFECAVAPDDEHPAVVKPAIRTALMNECFVEKLFCPIPQ